MNTPHIREDKRMRIGKLTSHISAIFMAIALENAAAQAHELEQVKTVFEHAIPNIKGESAMALGPSRLQRSCYPSYRA
jgi:hypothetical protein